MSAEVKVSQVDQRLAGIRGWLICPAIGLAVSPPLSLIWLVVELGSLDRMINYGFGAYVISRLIVNIGLLIYMCVAAVRFFKKLRTTVRTMIKLLIARAIASLALFVIGMVVTGGGNEALIISLLRSNNFIAHGLAAAVWIPYFRISKRAKATFVN
jgi:hypothetical protein